MQHKLARFASTAGAHFVELHVFVRQLDRAVEVARTAGFGVVALAARTVGAPADLIIRSVEATFGPADAVGGLPDGSVAFIYVRTPAGLGVQSRDATCDVVTDRFTAVLARHGVRKDAARIRVIQQKSMQLIGGMELLSDLNAVATG